MGVTAATGGLADDHDVLEFLTHSLSDRQVSADNQAATDEQARKYQEEYQKYEQELKQQQAEFVLSFGFLSNECICSSYRREHPEASTVINEQQLVGTHMSPTVRYCTMHRSSTRANTIENFARY
jgi:hypothetical protein